MQSEHPAGAMTNKEALTQAIKNAGSASALARALGITPSAVLLWKEVPAGRIVEVERLTGISRFDLRSDICGPAPVQAA